VAFTYAEPALRPVLLVASGPLTLDRVVGVPFWQLALGFAVVLAVALFGLERWRSWREEIGAAGDGLGAAAPEAERGPEALARGAG
jgi:hypothetical protein